MLAGRQFRGKIRFRLSVDITTLAATGGATAGGTYDCYLRTWHVGIFGALQTGILVRLTSRNSTTDSYLFEFVILDMGVSDTKSGAVWKPNVESIIEFPIKVYQDYRGKWYTETGDVTWICDGATTTYTGLGGKLAFGLTPAFLPFLGTPLAISPDIAADPTFSFDPCTAYDITGTMAGTVRGGYQIWDDDAPVPSWEDFPIHWNSPNLPAAPGGSPGLGVALTGITTGTNTWDAGLDLYSYGRSVGTRYRTDRYLNSEGEAKVGWFWVVPDIERIVNRGTLSDYALEVFRGGAPDVYEKGDWGYGDTTSIPVKADDVDTVSTEYGPIYNAEGTQVAAVRETTHATIESSFPGHRTMIYSIAHGISQMRGSGINEGGGCSDNGIDPPAYESGLGEFVGYQSVLHVDQHSSGELDYLDFEETPDKNIIRTSSGDFDGKDSVVRYWHHWVHPHWRFFARPYNHEVDGSAASWKDYWYELGQQWLGETDLPDADESDLRTDMISGHGPEGPNSATGGYIESLVTGSNYPTFWWGNWGYDVAQWALPASIQTDADSASRWTVKDESDADLTTSFGAGGISVTPPGSGDIIAKFDLASFTVEPYLYSAIAQRFEVLRDSSTIDRIRVYLVGSDGSEVELNETDVQTAGGAAWPTSGLVSTKYAGTWGRSDYSMGEITDSPSDDLGTGESATAMADTLRSSVLQLLPGRTAKYLKVVATPKAATSPVLLKYPKFFAPTTTPVVRYLGRQMAAILWPDGPGIVLGNWSFWNYLLDSFASTPLLYDIGDKSSVLDALCTQRLFEGRAVTDGLDTEIAGLYDSGVEYGPGAERRSAAYDTIAWWVISEDKVAACLQNTYMPPPIAWFPPRERDSDFLLASDRVMETIDWSKAPRDLILPGSTESQVKDPGGTTWTACDATSPSGWKVTRHSHAVDNTESGFHVARLGTNYATIRPWHGLLWVFGADESEAAGNVSHDIHRSGLRVRAYVSGGTAWAGKATRRGPWADSDTTFAAEWVSVRVEKSGKAPRVFLVVADSGAIKEYVSPDGVNYTLSSTLASGTLKYPAQDVEHDGTRYTYWLDGTTIKGLVRDRAGNTLASVSSAVTGVDDSGFSVRKTGGLDGKFRIEIQCIVGGAVVEYVSPDGITFS